MLNQVKVFDGKGKLKRIITQDEIANRHWKFCKSNNHIFAVAGSKTNFYLVEKNIICKVCKVSFTTNHARTLYCGIPCASKSVEIKRKEKLELKRKARRNAKPHKT
jgi:Zn finger protein HypA/HybF involved in hydrogenase expression